MSANTIPGSGPSSGFTKIGTAGFTGRVVSGLIPHAEPGSIVLRQLYPQPSVDIGVVDHISVTDSQLTIYPGHRSAWSDADRSALISFFTARYLDHQRLASQLGIGPLATATREVSHG